MVAEESKVEYYLKKEIKENNIIQKNSKNNYLIFGSDRKNKNLNKFLINNINIEDNTIYYYTDINISNNVRIDKKMNVELIHINGDDCNVNQLFTKMDAIIIPYNNDILNSGILSMARDYNLPVIGMEYLMKLYELNSKKVTSYMIDNNRLIYYEHKKKYVNDNWKKILS